MPTAESSGIRIPPPLFYLLGLFVGFGLERVSPRKVFPEHLSAAARVSGAAVFALGLGLAVWALRTFRRVGTTPNPTRPTTALASAGPYRFSRNPMYLSLGLMSAGIGLFANALWPVVLVPFVLVVIQTVVIRREERYLEGKFGQDYLAFKTRVRRWL